MREKKEKYYCVPYDYPPEIVDMARRRTEDLLRYSRISCRPITALIESAYLIGLMDGHQVTKENP